MQRVYKVYPIFKKIGVFLEKKIVLRRVMLRSRLYKDASVSPSTKGLPRSRSPLGRHAFEQVSHDVAHGRVVVRTAPQRDGHDVAHAQLGR